MSAMYALRVVEQLIEGLCGDDEMRKRFETFAQSISANGDLYLKRLSSALIGADIDRLLEIRDCIIDAAKSER